MSQERSTQQQDARQEKLEDVIRFLREAREKRFTGYIKINFSQGGVGRVERFEEVQFRRKNH